jgi:hypothetical protein
MKWLADRTFARLATGNQIPGTAIRSPRRHPSVTATYRMHNPGCSQTRSGILKTASPSNLFIPCGTLPNRAMVCLISQGLKQGGLCHATRIAG